MYDPLAFAQAKSNVVSQGTNALSSFISNIPQLVRQDAAFKQQEAAHADDESFKAQLYNEAKQGMQTIGKDPNSVPAPLAGEGRDEYMKRVAEFAAPFAFGAGDRLNEETLVAWGVNSNPAVADAIARQKYLNKNDPMGQIDMGTLPAGGTTTPEPASTGITDPLTGQTVPVGTSSKINDAPALEGPAKPPSFIDEMASFTMDNIRRINEGVRAGTISPQKATELVNDSTGDLMRFKIQEHKAEQDEKKRADKELKDREQKQIDDHIKSIVDARHENVPVYVDGKKVEQLDYEDLKNNPFKYKLGNKIVTIGGLGANTYQLNEIENEALSKAIREGRVDGNRINSRTAKLIADLELSAPGTDWLSGEGNAKFRKAIGTMNSLTLINSVQPLFERLRGLGDKLKNSDVQFANRSINWLKQQTGDPDIVAYNNARDGLIFETERILMGSGQMSDTKIKRAWDNVNSAQSPAQMESAYQQLEYEIQAREEALLSGPFPGAPASGTKPSGGVVSKKAGDLTKFDK